VNSCNHYELHCLNQFELIRKYACLDCGAVMMCRCDERIGRKFLPHQLDYGTELETQQRIAVTVGFQPSVCRECRGFPPETHLVAPIPGRTSKIRRYYWRELAFREMELFAEWAESHGFSPSEVSGAEAATAHNHAAQQALQEIKTLHEFQPKYIFQEESQAEIIKKYGVEVVNLKAIYLKGTVTKKVQLLEAGKSVSAEEYARHHLERQGYSVIFVESVPFHVLFGVYMWVVIQDPADPHVRIVGFGDRAAFETSAPSHEIWTHLPDDFGSPGYGRRRANAIEEHFSSIMQSREDLLWLFEYWLSYSEELRQYLWAHREDDIQTARQLVEILPGDVICNILRYLIDDYWRRYCGWPDLLAYKNSDFFFAEVKASGDKLSEDQKHWIRGNYQLLRLPFKLVKIHKASTIEA
jgi:hypothetical protein